jgi:hypothetical protein
VGKRITTSTTTIAPVGRRIVPGNELVVVGVVRDVKNTSLRTAAEPALDFAARQVPFRKMNVVVRGRRDASQLAAVGIYGILTYAGTHRRREIGIRLALGAQSGSMLRMVMREGIGLALAGCAIGIVCAFVARVRGLSHHGAPGRARGSGDGVVRRVS